MLPAMDTRTRHLRGVETIAIFVFPDRPFRSAPEFGGEGMVRVDYPSGNAWIIADPEVRIHLEPLPRGAVAILGDCAIPGEALRRILRAGTSVADAKIPDVGDAIVVLHRDGDTRIQGTLTGSTTVAWAHVEGDLVASDSALALAQVLDAPLDERRLALAIAENVPLHVLAGGTYWEGVRTVPPMHWLRITPGRPARTFRWWHPPAADRTLAQSGSTLRDSLLAVLSDTLESAPVVSADLSGGLDSTSIVYALTHLGATPPVFHASSASRWNDDVDWAARAATDLGLRQEMLGSFTENNHAFDVHTPMPPNLDHPPVWQASTGYLDALASRLVEVGSTIHFTGLGGDELFGYIPGLLRSLAESAGRGDPAIKRFRQLHRWPRMATARALASARTPADELTIALGRLRLPVGDGPEESLSWYPRVTLPPWASQHGESLVRSALEERISAGIAPLDEDRGRHQMLESLHFQGLVLRQINQAYQRSGVAWRAPFLAARVVDAAMTLRVEQRFGASTAKPLLAAATAPFMPHEYFTRNGKGEYSYDIYSQFAGMREQLIDYLYESELARRGLIDLDALASRIASPAAVGDVVGGIERLVSVEKWLRGTRSSTVDVSAVPPRVKKSVAAAQPGGSH